MATKYSDYYKDKMQNDFHKNPQYKKLSAHKYSVPETKNNTPAPNTPYIMPAKKNKIRWALKFLLIILLLIATISGIFVFPENPTRAVFISLSVIIVMMLILSLLHKFYEKIVSKLNPVIILFFVYILLILNMVLGYKIYSIEWAFLGFLIATVIIYDSKTDSRFLILPALILLGYIPFLLIAKYNSFAETISIYVYYFMVVGVVLQVIEHVRNLKNNLDFEAFIKRALKNFNWGACSIFIGIISIILIILNRFIEIAFLKWTFVYVFIVFLIAYWISTIKFEE